MIIPVVFVVIFVVPVTFVDMPSIRVVVIVRMGPVRTSIRRTPPVTVMPDPASALGNPVAIDPDVAWARYRRGSLVTVRRRRRADRDAERNLPKSRDGKSRG